MAVIKVSSTGKSFVIIGDDCAVYTVPLAVVKKMLESAENNDHKWGIVTLTRMPMDAAPGQFKKSPVYHDPRKAELLKEHGGSGLDINKVKAKDDVFTDKVVW